MKDKKLYNNDGTYFDQADVIEKRDELSQYVTPLVQRWLDDGYSLPEILHFITVNVEYQIIMNKMTKHHEDNEYDKLLDLASQDRPIAPEEIGLPSWRRDCDGFVYELNTVNPFCKSGIAYKHKNGYIWSTGNFLTKRECLAYKLEPGSMNN